MKKFILPVVVACALVFTSCGSDDDNDGDGNDCVELTQEATDAASAYATEATVANCNAYKASLESLIINECVEGDTATATQAIIDNLDCSE